VLATLYQLPNHDSSDVMQGWPFEYYETSSASSGILLSPATSRAFEK